MRTQKQIHFLVYVLALVCVLAVSSKAQSQRADEPLASMSGSSADLRWQPRVDYARLVLTVSTPDGTVLTREFAAGVAPSFNFTDDHGSRLPDGQYVYELRLVPNVSEEAKRALAASREKGSDEVVQELQRSGQLPAVSVQSGSFLLKAGTVYFDDGVKEPTNPKSSGSGTALQSAKQKPGGGFTLLDQVIPDDLIVQGSACVGLDCVNNESFGFDTIRLKENNTRIKFDDTSTGAGFPANDWQLTANDSASGGSSKFSIEDITGAKVPFTLTAGAPTNSVFVSSTGRVGFRTSTPALDLHVTTGDTPALRYEQTNASGFTAQTWDVAGNEANFFVRDVTGGSRLPLRIRPGAPTSSLDIAADGNVGIGVASASRKLEVSGTSNVGMKITDTSISNAAFLVYLRNGNGTLAGRQFSILDENALADRFIISSTGNIGIGGLLTPTNPLEHTSGARLTAAGVWTNASSRALKTNIRSITTSEAFRTLRHLNPVKYEYKAEPGETYAGFVAEDVPKLVATGDGKTLSPMDFVAVLTKVVQNQQRTIAELKERLDRIEKPAVKKARLEKRKAK